LSGHFDLVSMSQREAQAKFFRAPPKSVMEALKGAKLQLLDVGARGGIESGWQPYRHLIETILAEPDPQEAARLEAEGYHVIPRLIGGRLGTGVLNLCEKGGASSVLEPGGAFHSYFAADEMERFQVKERIERPMTTVGQLVKERGAPFDYLKLDTQGSELDIIRGLGDVLPLVIKTEISFAPLYHGSATIFEVAQALWERGYTLFHLAYVSKSAPTRQRRARAHRGTLLPLHGDAWFCPDWTREEGRALMLGRMPQYQALMHVFALEDVADYAISHFPQ
jgi:FkbM family methyltransferase